MAGGSECMREKRKRKETAARLTCNELIHNVGHDILAHNLLDFILLHIPCSSRYTEAIRRLGIKVTLQLVVLNKESVGTSKPARQHGFLKS